MNIFTRLRLLLQTWKEAWFTPLEYDETAMGIEALPLQGTYQIWVSIRGTKLFWLSGHRSRESAEAALTQVVAWAKRHGQMDLATHAMELTLLCANGDFRARPPSERLQEGIRQRIKQRDPSILIVRAESPLADDLQGPMNETVPDERTMQLLRATNQVKAWLQLRALSEKPQEVPPDLEGEEVTL